MAAIVGASAGDYLSRGGFNLTNLSSTIMAWVMLLTDLNQAGGVIEGHEDASGVAHRIALRTDGTGVSILNNNGSADGSGLVVGQWTHLTVVNNTLYRNAVVDASGPGTTGATNSFYLGANEAGSARAHLKIAHIRVWPFQMAVPSVTREFLSPTPVNPYVLFADRLIDSAPGWTVNGSITFDTDDPYTVVPVTRAQHGYRLRTTP